MTMELETTQLISGGVAYLQHATARQRRAGYKFIIAIYEYPGGALQHEMGFSDSRKDARKLCRDHNVTPYNW